MVRAALEKAVGEIGGRPASREALEAHRVLRGIPGPCELTEERNPLEAGLWDAVSFDKGCYVGQEVVARLNTYDKVARTLIGLDIASECELPAPGSDIVVCGRVAGTLTSVVQPPDREHAVGLGYVKRREIPDDRKVQIGSSRDAPVARLVELPFD